ncbi:MAG: glycerophosphodiester phosphodiesterase [Clostridia bacterium]|nr:glycerophosphodiester phosphodiesterase [Clostridia bacterium]
MLVALLVLGILLLILLCLYILSLKPAKHRPEKLFPFKNTYVAHRGFYNNKNIPENSIKAFRAAIKNCYAIELDVQLTKDNRLVVFHDATLKRMCGVKRKVSDCTYEELLSCNLLDTYYKIPLFSEVLELVGGKVPLLIEVKAHEDIVKTVTVLDEHMRTYNGIYAVQSFHPGVCAWYKNNRPEVPRGILSTNYRKNKIKKPPLLQFALSNLLFNFWAKPDFIAYNHKYADQLSYKIARELYKFDNAAWTIRSQEELEHSSKVFDIFIFDSFEPR